MRVKISFSRTREFTAFNIVLGQIESRSAIFHVQENSLLLKLGLIETKLVMYQRIYFQSYRYKLVISDILNRNQNSAPKFKYQFKLSKIGTCFDSN